DRNRSHWSTSKTPSYTKSVSWQHHPGEVIDSTLLPPNLLNNGTTEQSDVTEVSEAHLSLDDAGGTALEEMEKQMIREALSRHNSKKQVADELGIGIATLYRKIKKYELLNT
ncbi:helix-turn-helix domain-containing protein, partial [Escherichia coli]